MKLPRGLEFFGIAILLFLSVGSNAQPVANDDFYIVDKTQYIDTYENDAGYSDAQIDWSLWLAPSTGSGASPGCAIGLGCCRYCTIFSPAPVVAFDSYQYRYEPCCGAPSGSPSSNIATVSVLMIPNDDRQNAGRSCPIVGQPVNVTNGNMWLEQRDYSLPGISEIIDINRFYNSIVQSSGLFGFGWTTQYDESIQLYGDKMIRYI
jgi:hypothetical protein